MTGNDRGIRPPRPADLRELAEAPPGPHVAIYVPVEMGFAERKQNSVRYGQAVQSAVERLREQGLAAADADRWSATLQHMEPSLRDLSQPVKAFAVLMDARGARAFALPQDGAELVAVGRSYVLRPLVRAVHVDHSFRVLAFSVNRVAMFEGDATTLRPLEAARLPASMEDALGAELGAEGLQMHSVAPGSGTVVFHGHGGAADERRTDLERYCRAVGRGLAETMKGWDGRLVLAADQSSGAALRLAAAKVPQLLPVGIQGNPDYLSLDDLHARAWRIVQEAIDEQDRETAGAFERARNLGKAAIGVEAVIPAAVAGRVRRLWFPAGLHRPGCIDEGSASIVDATGDEDVLDELIGIVLRRSGESLVVDPDRMPAEAEVAAELR